MPLLGDTSAYARAAGYFLKHPRQNPRSTNQTAFTEFCAFLEYLAPAGVPLQVSTKDFWAMIRTSTPIAHVTSTGLRERTVPYYHWCTFFGVPDIEDLARMTAETPNALAETYQSTWATYQQALEKERAQVNTQAATRRTKNVVYKQLGEQPHKIIPAGVPVYISAKRARGMLGCSVQAWERLRAHLGVSFRVAALWGEGDEAVDRALQVVAAERLRGVDQCPQRVYTYDQACEVLGVSRRVFRLGRDEVGGGVEAYLMPDVGVRPSRLISEEKILEISRIYLDSTAV
ncbi:MAG: hypothetical protein HXO58_07820 [Rothia mucilaginosa]|uniref:Uncharacterized protein n=1 Tax=Rothia mucilaginosa TaxID=43675 RepID=A0A930L6E7_9MICC|nr:hypothetical protein [Rothia mucilaginosa]MBF1659726.1 hypothetical protein [Rothia mucilaginosa]